MDNQRSISSPYPWFGGKSSIAHVVWGAFGNIKNYIEPFFGSGAILLANPNGKAPIETINDKDCFVINFWRAVQHDPDEVAIQAYRPINEAELQAAHLYLIKYQENIEKVQTDIDFYDAKMAGLWVWGLCNTIMGGHWCSGRGPWISDENGKWIKKKVGKGVIRGLPNLCAIKGINRTIPYLHSIGTGITKVLSEDSELHLIKLKEWMNALNFRMRYVRVCCGEWHRILGPSVTYNYGSFNKEKSTEPNTAIFLDPPYAMGEDTREVVYAEDSVNISHKVREWAIENGDNPKLRIALCGYEGEHVMPQGWTKFAWKTNGGYSNSGKIETRGKKNKNRERVWFSKYCLNLDSIKRMSMEPSIDSKSNLKIFLP